MMIVTGEQDVKDLDRIFDELDRLTREPYARLKKELDGILAAGYGVSPEDLMPWHYHDPFFQRTPLVYELDLDQYYKGRDVEALARKYYAGIGLPIDEILAKSDLYDARASTRTPSVTTSTGAATSASWPPPGHRTLDGDDPPRAGARGLRPIQGHERALAAPRAGPPVHNRGRRHVLRPAQPQRRLDAEDARPLRRGDREIRIVSDRYLRFQEVLFTRWALVMWHFEKALYADPDQDLNTLWWDLVENTSRSSGRRARPTPAGPPSSTSPQPPATTTTTCSASCWPPNCTIISFTR
jgi:peptidyl-dipeptidase A